MSDPARRELDAELLAWMQGDDWSFDEDRFERTARAVFAFQFEHCAPYRRFCEARGRTPDDLESWHRIPAVPTGAFKELALTSFPLPQAVHTFRTSGTSVGPRGELHLDTLALYEASLLPSFRRAMLADLTKAGAARLLVLAPSPEEAPDSSLSHMFGVIGREIGPATFLVRDGELCLDETLEALDRAGEVEAALLLCGTAFAFVHLLEHMARRGVGLTLPAHARVMETGGFKGRSREMSRETLYAELEKRLGVVPSRMVNQYGMTELGSQFYDSVLARPDTPRRKLGPPWARVRIADPVTGEDVAQGEVGTIFVTDLANTGSVAAIQTADLGRTVGDGFEVLGREPGAEQRGCSIAADELLAGAAQ